MPGSAQGRVRAGAWVCPDPVQGRVPHASFAGWRANFGGRAPLVGLDGIGDGAAGPDGTIRPGGSPRPPRCRRNAERNIMTETNFRPAAFSAALLALAFGAGLSAAPAFAQETVVVPAGARVVYAEPVVAPELDAVPPNAFGHFTCTFNEAHTRLERKACGGTHYRYGF